MKKLLLLLIIPFFLTGCYDYQELNNRAIVAGMGIDFNKDEFTVTLEILNSKKSESEKESTNKTSYVKGVGKTIEEAMQDAHFRVSKDAYYSHLKVMVISEEVAKDKVEDIIDYLLREPNIRNIFIPVMAQGCSAADILETISTENPVSSENIQILIENNKKSENVALDQDFENFIDSFVDNRKDAALTIIKKEDDALVLGGIAAFHGSKLVTVLNNEEAGAYKVLKNDSNNHFIKTYCNEAEKKYITINLYQNKKTEIKYDNDKLMVKSNLLASIVSDECKYDFRNPNVYPELENIFQKVIEKEYAGVLEKLQKNKADILYINSNYYKSKRKELTNWYDLDIEFETKLDINKNGLIFKVTNDEQS